MQKPRTHWILQDTCVPHTVAEVLDVLLANRGLTRDGLDCRLEDLDAHARAIRNLDDAAGMVAHAVRERARIVLVGDYDCDGLTALAQIALFLRDVQHFDFTAVTPQSRAEGYGMPVELAQAHAGAGLFIVLDCGTFDVDAVAAARANGAEVVVIDHHEIDDVAQLAPASVLVNPRHPECRSEFKEFATAGLVLLFLARLRQALAPDLARRPSLNGDYLALAAVGTIADMMPLKSANRIIARHGLALINRGANPAVQALRAVAGLAGRTLTAGHIGFQIGPRLNAAARVAEARVALDLLLSQDPAEITRLANQLNELNRKRQQQVEAVMGTLAAEIAAMPARRTLVFAHPDYPLGVNGIFAQRAVREAYRPAIFLQTFPAEGIATGSARSIPGFDLYGALRECADLLERWGGHAMAAGLTLRLDRLDAFRARLEAVGERYAPEVFEPVERADVELDPRLIGPALVRALADLEPHGVGNPGPRFLLRGQRIASKRAFGSAARRDHLEITLPGGLRAVFWGGAGTFSWPSGSTVDLVCGLSWDEYRGAPQLEVRDAGVSLLRD
jgi:single-stranded-DNA-specific exonuclease